MAIYHMRWSLRGELLDFDKGVLRDLYMPTYERVSKLAPIHSMLRVAEEDSTGISD